MPVLQCLRPSKSPLKVRLDSSEKLNSTQGKKTLDTPEQYPYDSSQQQHNSPTGENVMKLPLIGALLGGIGALVGLIATFNPNVGYLNPVAGALFLGAAVCYAISAYRRSRA